MTTIRPGRPRFVLFDWDNTLVDTWPVILDCYNAVFEDLGMASWTMEEVKQRAHGSLRDLFPAMFGARAPRATEVFFETFHKIHLERLTPREGAVELLTYLSQNAIVMGVVSNKVGKNLRLEAQHLGWHDRFHSIVGATDAVRDKPAADPIHLALEGSGIHAGAQVWMVGDTRADLLSAHAAGCVPVLLREEQIAAQEFADCPPTVHARNCHALLALLSADSPLY